MFVHPHFEGKGIGRKLFRIMVDWAFDQEMDKLWLGTAPGAKAERFYSTIGCRKMGLEQNGKIRFECTKECGSQPLFEFYKH